MKRLWILSLLLIGLAAVQSSAQAVGRLSVELRPASKEVQKKFGVSAGIVEVVLKNTGDEAVEVDKDSIPPPMTETGRLTLGFFEVVGADGKQAPYTSLIAESADNGLQTEVIAPNKSLVRQVNILKNYKLVAGQQYTISLLAPVRYLDRPRGLLHKASSDDLRSLLKSEEASSTQIKVDSKEDINAAQAYSRAAQADAVVECTNPQEDAFDKAKTEAQKMAVEASGFYTSQMWWTTTPPIQARFKNEPRFVSWFGRHPDPYDGATGPGPIDSALRTRININPTRIQQMTLNCNCDDPNANPTTDVVYVYPTIPYVVHACPLFWTAPLLPTSRDENSKVGSLIHEGIHFTDQYYTGTPTHLTGPTYQEALNLVLTNREAATKNPNNFKFYTLNQSW